MLFDRERDTPATLRRLLPKHKGQHSPMGLLKLPQQLHPLGINQPQHPRRLVLELGRAMGEDLFEALHLRLHNLVVVITNTLG